MASLNLELKDSRKLKEAVVLRFSAGNWTSKAFQNLGDIGGFGVALWWNGGYWEGMWKILLISQFILLVIGRITFYVYVAKPQF